MFWSFIFLQNLESLLFKSIYLTFFSNFYGLVHIYCRYISLTPGFYHNVFDMHVADWGCRKEHLRWCRYALESIWYYANILRTSLLSLLITRFLGRLNSWKCIQCKFSGSSLKCRCSWFEGRHLRIWLIIISRVLPLDIVSMP